MSGAGALVSKKVSAAFRIDISPGEGRGAAGYITRATERPAESFSYMIYQLPGRQFLGGFFYFPVSPNKAMAGVIETLEEET
jgi:hypothetical protein